MKGFGHNDRIAGKSIKKNVKKLDTDKLISNAFSLHSVGKIKEASEI